ncbi:MAG: membrane protein insertase YidC [Bacteroidales bacterium]|nr:membrane protein insertase YidC [Bacteroidales bacterium]
MDRKSLIGLLLIGGLLIAYSIWTRPSKEEMAAKRVEDSIQQVAYQNDMEARRLQVQKDSIDQLLRAASSQDTSEVVAKVQDDVARERLLGSFADAAEGEEKLITLQNDKIRLRISSKGGHLYSAELKEYKTWDKKPLILFEGEDNEFNIKFYSQNKAISTKDLFFVPQSDVDSLDASNSKQSLAMRLSAGDGRYMDFVYTLEPGAYQLGFEVKMNGLDQLIGRTSPFMDLDWSYPLRQQERAAKFESQYSSVYYKYLDDEVGHLQARKEGATDLSTKVKWIGFKQQFFSSVLVADNFFTSAKISSTNMPPDSGFLKLCSAAISMPLSGKAQESIPMHFYFLPNNFKTLKKYDQGFENVVDLGWPFISWINKWFVINIFHYLEGVIGNYGIIIIILTVLFKSILLPLSYKSFVSGAKMRVLKPQIDELSKKYSKDKAMEKQQATMALYKKAGVNPMGGCLPMLLQMPIWLALFRFFPASIELRQQSFLWATDLSSYDSIINLPFTIPAYGDHVSLFTLLMAISMALTTKINMSQTDTGQGMPGMKMMTYLMPVMMLVFFNSYASGLSFYYFVSNVITCIQMTLIKRSVDEEKILLKMNQNQKKPKKKSGFQARLEKMARERQKMAKKK